MWALGQSQDFDAVCDLMMDDIAREISFCSSHWKYKIPASELVFDVEDQVKNYIYHDKSWCYCGETKHKPKRQQPHGGDDHSEC